MPNNDFEVHSNYIKLYMYGVHAKRLTLQQLGVELEEEEEGPSSSWQKTTGSMYVDVQYVYGMFPNFHFLSQHSLSYKYKFWLQT